MTNPVSILAFLKIFREGRDGNGIHDGATAWLISVILKGLSSSF